MHGETSPPLYRPEQNSWGSNAQERTEWHVKFGGPSRGFKYNRYRLFYPRGGSPGVRGGPDWLSSRACPLHRHHEVALEITSLALKLSARTLPFEGTGITTIILKRCPQNSTSGTQDNSSDHESHSQDQNLAAKSTSGTQHLNNTFDSHPPPRGRKSHGLAPCVVCPCRLVTLRAPRYGHWN